MQCKNLKKLILKNFNYSKQAIGFLAQVIQMNRSSLEELEIDCYWKQGQGGDMHKRTLASFLESISSVGMQLKKLSLEGIPMNEFLVMQSLVKIFTTVPGLQ